MSFDVFISYRHSQKAIILALCEALSAANITYFRDEERREDDASIQKTIENGLANSHLFLAWYDPSYLQSKACAWEFSRALLAAQLSGSGLQRIIAVDPSGTFNHILPTTLLDQARVVSGDDVTALIQHLTLRLTAINTPFGSIAAGSNAGWYERDRPTHPTWVGRAGDLIKLFHQLDVGRLGMFAGERAPVAITGWGGEGKTMLAQQYALRFAAAYPAGVVWLSGATADGVTPREGEWLVQLESALTISAIGKLALPINELLQGQTDAVQRIRILKEAIDRNLKAQATKTSANAISPYLWIIDDLPDRLSAEQQQLWLPVDEQIHCLATIRESRGIDGVFHPFAISGLDDAEAMTILTRLKPASTDAEKLLAKQIIEGLGSLPLALSLAAVIISSLGYQQYIEFINQSTTAEVDALIENIAPALPSGHARSIVNTFLRSLQQIPDDDAENASEADKASWLILRLIALLAPIAAPDILVTLVLEHAGFGNKAFKLRINAIAKLHQDALIKREGANADQSSMHALMARTVLEVKSNTIQQQDLQEALLPAMGQWAKQEADKPPIESDKRLLDVAIKLSESNSISNFYSVIWQVQIEAFRCGSYPNARRLEKKVLALSQAIFGEHHSETLTSMHNLALIMQLQGELKEARQLQEQVLQLSKQVSGEQHFDTFRAMSSLAHTMQKQGELIEARQLQQQALQLSQQILGKQHPDTLTIMHLLADTMQLQGELKEARQLQEQVLQLNKQILGESHTSTVAAMHNLAATMQKQGELKEARQMQEQVLQLQQKILGIEHPHTLAAINNLAKTMQKQGELKEARQMQEHLLQLKKQISGVKHPETLTTMHNLSLTIQSQGKLEEARQLQEQVLQLRKQILGEYHTSTIESCWDLYDTLLKIGKLKEISDFEDQKITSRGKINPEDDTLLPLFTHMNGEREKHNLPNRDFGKP